MPLPSYHKARPGADLVVMLINDQVTDRRAVQQAQSLKEAGFRVEFVSWRHTANDPIFVEGFKIHRIDYAALEEAYYNALLQLFVLGPRVAASGAVDTFNRAVEKELKAVLRSSDDALSGIQWRLRRVPLFAIRKSVAYVRRMKGKGVRLMNAASNKLVKQLSQGYHWGREPEARVKLRQVVNNIVHSRLHHQFGRERVYAIQSHDLDTAWLGMRLAASLGVPFVFDAHEIYVEQLGLEPAFKTYYSNLEPTVLQYSAFWMIPNELAGRWMVEEYKKKGITVPEPLVSQNSFDYWKNPGRSNAIREALGLDATVKIALYQGGVTPLRNLDVIVKAASFLKDPWRIVFLGNGSEVEALHQLAGKLLNKRVFFLPAVSQDELLRYTASADVGLIPYGGVDVNTLFASPNKLYEYLQAALPILANRLPFLALKLEQTGSGILTDFSDPKAVAAALHDLDDKTLAKLRRKARKAKEVECWEEEAKPYVHRYLELGWKAGNPNKRVLV